MKLDKKLSGQVMGNLPKERLKPASPWYSTSIDLFGPFTIRDAWSLIALEPELYIWTLRQTTAQKVFLWCWADLSHLEDIYQRSIPTTARNLSQQVRNLRMLRNLGIGRSFKVLELWKVLNGTSRQLMHHGKMEQQILSSDQSKDHSRLPLEKAS